jgi:hypothetical protein
LEKEISLISTNKEEHLEYMKDIDSIPDIESKNRSDYPKDVETYGLIDTHMHIDNMEGKKWRVPSQEKISDYFLQKGIVQAGTIFEKKISVTTLLNTLEEKEVECSILPFYFIHNPLDIDRERVEYLYKSNLLKGFKLHPVYDNYPLSYDILKDVLNLSKDYGSIPILTHLDDRKESMDLTAPHRLDGLIERMIDEDRVVPLILGHTGAYAHPRLVLYKDRANPPVLQYWMNESHEEVQNYSRLYLIKHALHLAKEYPFVHVDSSSCVNKIKAKLITDSVNQFPELSKKILLGTDFPVLSQYKVKTDGTKSFNVGVTVSGQLKALWNQGLKKEYLLQIISNRIP